MLRVLCKAVLVKLFTKETLQLPRFLKLRLTCIYLSDPAITSNKPQQLSHEVRTTGGPEGKRLCTYVQKFHETDK